MKKKIIHIISYVLFAIMLIVSSVYIPAGVAYAAKETADVDGDVSFGDDEEGSGSESDELTDETGTRNIRVCIDPGHGGENLGADWNGYLEKEMTLVVAEAMKEELEQYEGIEVYMTRTSDVDMSLEERVDYAAEVGADFFFCLHFNMSADHDMYGAECWISAFDTKYAAGMDFSKIEMGLLCDLGLYDRGIKTRLNSKGTNYYGVLRMADLEEIPGVIIEHCHLDHHEDEPFYDEHDMLVEYGKLDATAVAMYYGLRSESLGQDFSGYHYDPVPVPDECVRPDDTDPEEMSVSFGEPYVRDDVYYVDVSIRAYDPDCRMLYYSYSTDSGLTWSERMRWQDDEDYVEDSDTVHTTVQLPEGRDINAIFRAYNLYNLDTASSPYYISALPSLVREEEKVSVKDEDPSGQVYTDISRIDETEEKPGHLPKGADYTYFILFAGLSLGFLIVLGIMCYVIVSARRRR